MADMAAGALKRATAFSATAEEAIGQHVANAVQKVSLPKAFPYSADLGCGRGTSGTAPDGIVQFMTWIPQAFRHPDRVDLPTGHHLRPIREDDVDIDYPAVMRSRDRLWAKYGQAWGWPSATMSYLADKEDLARHEAEIAKHETFNYAVLDEKESALFGCVYIDPPDRDSPPGTEAITSWWVIDEAANTELERALDDFVPRWLRDHWGFSNVSYSP